ncbi:MAG: hypothetical protein EOO38_15625, partial [Cytophagaceae bacterium]
MTIKKGILTVAASTLLFTPLGALIGWLLGVYVPGYYRGLYLEGNSPEFDPVQMGLGLGMTQGLIGGIVVGLAIT